MGALLALAPTLVRLIRWMEVWPQLCFQTLRTPLHREEAGKGGHHSCPGSAHQAALETPTHFFSTYHPHSLSRKADTALKPHLTSPF